MNRRYQRWVRTIVTGLLISFSMALAAPAFAQEDLEAMSFEELIERAKTAYQSEDYRTAVKYLIAANLKQPNARLLLNVAKSYEKTGDCVRALVYYRAFIRHPDAEKSLIADAQSELRKANQCEGWDELMSGRLLVTTEPSGASVLLDDKEVGTTPVEITGVVEGPHVVAVERDGFEPESRQIDLRPDVDDHVAFKLVEKAPEVATTEQTEVQTEVDTQAETATGTSNTVHYIAAGGITAVGLGLVAGGLLTDLSLPDRFDTPRESLDPESAEYQALTADRKSAATLATILYISGGVVAAGGIGYLVYTVVAGGEKEKPPTVGGNLGGIDLALSPSFGPGGLGVSLNGEF